LARAAVCEVPTVTTTRATAALTTPDLLAAFRRVRATTEALCAGLEPEDLVVQPMTDASPLKWHLAHTSWFFETFLLLPNAPGYRPFDPAFAHLFNSYYNTAGPQFARARRGLLSRPTVQEVLAYRRHVDDALAALLAAQGETAPAELTRFLVVGLNHEQQHQELMLTDLKALFALNPLQPIYKPRLPASAPAPAAPGWFAHAGGLVEIGHAGEGFAWDNESPRHRVFLEPFAVATRVVTCGEFAEFLDDGGYGQPLLWLSDGWDAVRAGGWSSPLYWQRQDGAWHQFTLAGQLPVDPDEPVCHLSFYEADAYARWRGARLPTEAEWETVAAGRLVAGNFAESGRCHPAPASSREPVAQLFGDVWEWTASPYVDYPGYAPPAGALGEYNAKFMCNQLVLRGGSCATPADHVRATYRNFFGPAARWQFSGLRLARGEGAS
jgi:ergothioneine biosynthesis protein EgtB